MTRWKSEEVLARWLAREAEDKQYVEEHLSEMGEEMDEAFHRDILYLLQKHEVNTNTLNTVGILNALEKLILRNR